MPQPTAAAARSATLPAELAMVALAGIGVGGAVAGSAALVLGRAPTPLLGHTVEDAVLALAYATAGLLVARRAAGNPVGWLFLVTGGCYGLLGALTLFGTGATAGPALAAAWVSGWLWVPALALPVTVVLLVFPDGRLPSPRWRAPLGAAVLGVALAAAGLALAPETQTGVTTAVPNPLAVPGSGILAGAGLALVVLACLAGVASLVSRFRRAVDEERARLAPFVAAGLTIVVGLAVVAVRPDWAPVVQLLTFPLLPAAAAVCVLRYRLYDTEILVRRWVTFLGLSALVLGGYLLTVNAVAALLRRDPATLEAVVATTAVAVAFGPVRAALQRSVGRVLYGRRDEPYDVLAGLGAQLAGGPEPAAALRAAVAAIAEAMRVPWVQVTVPGDTAVVAGRRPEWATERHVTGVELRHVGQPQGELLVAHRGPHDPLSPADHALLTHLAAPVAALLAAIRTAADLRRSRDRLVASREEERRRLRQDLHDGLGPMLSAMRLQIDVADRRLAERPAGVAEVLARLRRTADEAVLDVRRLVEGLRPPALDELGLAAALAEHARRVDAAPHGPHVALAPHADLPALPAAVEVAAYRIACEAVANALRHAGAARIEIALAVVDGELRVRVRDDGRGLPADADDGVGLGSMRRRADEIGGTVSVQARTEGGTQVCARLPAGSR